MTGRAVDLRERLRADALGLGFDQVGFAPAAEPTHAEAYLRWLDRGRHGEMAYMAREDAVRRRLSPDQALPGCRTIIVASLRYGREGDDPPSPGGEVGQPIIARYARGRDYHIVFEELLGKLAQRIAGLKPGSESRLYVDYGPVLERDHAQRAGLGWIGKNTMLIHPDLGSYLLLGELLTTLDLPPDEPFTADRCGTCRRCIDACPTGAILEAERGVDARLCISYLTIELRGSIPVELRPLIGVRVFGCDICQEVCPWNSVAGKEPEPESAPAGEPDRARALDLLELPEARALAGRPWPAATMIEWARQLLEMEEDQFRELYGETPLARPRRDGMLRNLCVGLGNAGGPAARSVLERCAVDRSDLVREHAEWALGRLADRAGRPGRSPPA
jgi:epoxyqueuosine reductase